MASALPTSKPRGTQSPSTLRSWPPILAGRPSGRPGPSRWPSRAASRGPARAARPATREPGRKRMHFYRVSGVFRHFYRVSGVFMHFYRVSGVFMHFYKVSGVFYAFFLLLMAKLGGDPSWGPRCRVGRRGAPPELPRRPRRRTPRGWRTAPGRQP